MKCPMISSRNLIQGFADKGFKCVILKIKRIIVIFDFIEFLNEMNSSRLKQQWMGWIFQMSIKR